MTRYRHAPMTRCRSSAEWRSVLVHGNVLVRCHAGCQPDAADDTLATETTGEAYVVLGIGYLAEIVGEIAGPTVKLDSTDGTTPILITDPPIPACWCRACHPLTDSAAVRPARRARPLNWTRRAAGAGRSKSPIRGLPYE
jgi:hypothetical protein